MLDLLHSAFRSGQLLKPDWSRANSVDLIHAIASLNGNALPLSRNGAELAAQIGTHEHYIFILIDGMGLNLLERLEAESFLRTHCAGELRAVFPSTTSAAITTLATGLWPAEHGVLGWWQYLAEQGLSVTALPFVERFTKEPLTKRNFDAGLLWPFPPLLSAFGRNSRSIHPAAFWDSTFNRFARGHAEGTGYTSIPSAIDQVIGRIVTADGPSFTYLYLPELDETCHLTGTDSAATLARLRQLEEQIARLAQAVENRARIIITADHGHQNVLRADHFPLYDNDPLLKLLIVPPTGEPRVPLFHVRAGRQEEFRARFEQRFAPHIALLSADEADELRLFGPMPLSVAARRRLGDFVGITVGPVTLTYYPPPRSPADDHVSHHAGMSPAEMRVPLILI